MAAPKAVKITKNGVEIISKIDRANYTIRELTRAAQRDTAKLVRKRVLQDVRTLPGMRRQRRPYRSTQYWVRGRELDCLIGFKHGSWYGSQQELGDSKQPKRGFLKKNVMKSIPEIRQIQGQYLSAVEDENRALGLIDEGEYISPENGEG